MRVSLEKIHKQYLTGPDVNYYLLFTKYNWLYTLFLKLVELARNCRFIINKLWLFRADPLWLMWLDGSSVSVTCQLISNDDTEGSIFAEHGPHYGTVCHLLCVTILPLAYSDHLRAAAEGLSCSNTTRHRCDVRTSVAQSTNVTTYLLTYLLTDCFCIRRVGISALHMLSLFG